MTYTLLCEPCRKRAGFDPRGMWPEFAAELAARQTGTAEEPRSGDFPNVTPGDH